LFSSPWLRLGTAWLVASVWFLALIAECGIYLYVRDTDLYGSAPNKGTANSTASSSLAEEGGARDQELNAWRSDRQRRFPKYEEYLRERQAQDLSHEDKRYERYRAKHTRKEGEDQADDEEKRAQKQALDVGATNQILAGESHLAMDPGVHVDGGDAAAAAIADDGGGGGVVDGGGGGGG